MKELIEALELPIDINKWLDAIARVNGIKRLDIEVPEDFPEALDRFNYVNDKDLRFLANRDDGKID